MFESEEQRAFVVKTLLASVDLGHLWTVSGPTDEAVDIIDRFLENLELPGWSSGERIMFQAALDVWNGRGSVSLDDVLHRLDPKRLGLVATFILAFSEGGAAIDRWIVKHAAPNP